MHDLDGGLQVMVEGNAGAGPLLKSPRVDGPSGGSDRRPEAPPRLSVAEYVATFLADRGVRHVFMVTGGGAMHLNDALGYEQRLQCVCQHHEQACSMAAEGYARVTGKIGVLNVTTGPGGINSLSGVFGAWTDSIPLFVVSGQVRRDTVTSLSSVPSLRQLGDQETDIVRMAEGITKYAVLIDDPKQVRYHLEKAYHLALSGRPGPVWVDIPVDVQGAKIDPAELEGFDPPPMEQSPTQSQLASMCSEVLDRLKSARRPVLLIGTGIRVAGALAEFERVIRMLGIPVTLGWTAVDALASDDPLYCGRPGTVGDRAGNFVVQNADLLIVIGCRLSIRQVSYNWQSFARNAYKVVVDIDRLELEKPMVRPDLPICADAKQFLAELERQLSELHEIGGLHADWLAWGKERLRRFPIMTKRLRKPNGDRINPYHFMDMLFTRLDRRAIVVCGNATASVASFQAATIKNGQRVFANAGCAAMGYDLPASIGAAFGSDGRHSQVVCLAGDGSIQLNIQEFQTVVHHALPIKIFVLNNNGYLSMRLTQDGFFKRRIGEGPRSGVSFPDIKKLAAAYGISAIQLTHENCGAVLDEVLAAVGPYVVEVLLDPEQGFEPKVGSRRFADGRIVSSPLEDMSPLLCHEELRANMLVPFDPASEKFDN